MSRDEWALALFRTAMALLLLAAAINIAVFLHAVGVI